MYRKYIITYCLNAVCVMLAYVSGLLNDKVIMAIALGIFFAADNCYVKYLKQQDKEQAKEKPDKD